MLVINPDECIDCGVCVPECPAEAIVANSEPGATAFWLEINRDYAGQWPNITVKKPHLEDASKYEQETGKFEKYFSPNPGSGD